MDIRHIRAETTIGELEIVADGPAITGIYFPNHAKHPGAGSLGKRTSEEQDPLLSRTAQQIREYLAHSRKSFDIPLAPVGDETSQRIWSLLTEIPYGSTVTYGQIAETLGDRNLAQRVGQAVGRNPISIIVPCHRVVGAGGALTGYAGGLERKRILLELEEPAEAAAERLF